jgi:hypothetical protein
MGINQNHLFEELNGVKCAIVEKNASPARIEFLKKILEVNHFIVVVVASPPPKAAVPATPAPKVDASGSTAEKPIVEKVSAPSAETTTPPETFTIGVTDVTFNPVNAIFGRLLHTEDGHVITLAYWQQKDRIARDDIPYFDEV